MALVVEVQVEIAAWRRAWPRVVTEAKGLLLTAARHPKLVKPGHGDEFFDFEVAVVFCGDKKLRELNFQFRGKDRPTNVLSFPDGDNAPGGGIALSFETISAEAKAQGKPFLNHTKHMILHGFLHLLGFDHEKSRAARLMERLEIAILADMGIPNPYLIETPRRA
jgi:probable rRNA maturation factor